MISASRVGPLVIAVAASALLVAGPAYAQAKPPAGSAACDQLVDADPAVVTAGQGSAGGLPAAKKAAEAQLCGPATPSSSATTTTTTTSSTPTRSSPPKPPGPPPPGGQGGHGGQGGRPPGQGPNDGNPAHGGQPRHPGRPAADRDCDDFATQKEAQQYFESIGGSSTNDADRLDENHNGVACESLADDGDNQDAAVTTTGDDDSDATTSGNQVTEVPEGSAQTGGF